MSKQKLIFRVGFALLTVSFAVGVLAGCPDKPEVQSQKPPVADESGEAPTQDPLPENNAVGEGPIPKTIGSPVSGERPDDEPEPDSDPDPPEN